MKKIIRLTESDLHRIVKESVQKVLKEQDMFLQQLKDDAASGELNNKIRGFNRKNALGTQRADYAGNDLDYYIIKIEFEDAIDKMESNRNTPSWW